MVPSSRSFIIPSAFLHPGNPPSHHYHPHWQLSVRHVVVTCNTLNMEMKYKHRLLIICSDYVRRGQCLHQRERANCHIGPSLGILRTW